MFKKVLPLTISSNKSFNLLIDLCIYFAGPNVHVAHFDMNRFNQMPINRLLQLAGMQVVDFNMPKHAKIIDI